MEWVTRQKVSVTEPIEQGKKEQDRLRDMKCGSTPREWPLGGPRDQGAGESERESYHRTLSPLIVFCPFVTLFRSPCPHLHFSSCPLLIFPHLARTDPRGTAVGDGMGDSTDGICHSADRARHPRKGHIACHDVKVAAWWYERPWSERPMWGREFDPSVVFAVMPPAGATRLCFPVTSGKDITYLFKTVYRTQDAASVWQDT